MAATAEEVTGWIIIGKSLNATYIISVCDTFNYDDYPIYVGEHENVQEKAKKYDYSTMQKINEVIDLSKYDRSGNKIA